MHVEFIEPALIELDDAIAYYELQMGGLGKIFFEQVTETIKLIEQFPDIWTQNSTHTRRATLRKFPYNLIYSILKNKIYIIAVAHQNRKPEYWMDRFIKD